MDHWIMSRKGQQLNIKTSGKYIEPRRKIIPGINLLPMPFSISLTTMERYDLTIKSIEQVLDDTRISDIVLLDDASTNGDYERLRDYYQNIPKVRVIRQLWRKGMSVNKKDAVALARNSHTVLFDSDNILDPTYLNVMEGIILDEKTIYLPSKAAPNFDFTAFSGLTFDKRNIKEYLDQPMFDVALNACNYVCPVEEYTRVFEEDTSVKETDTLYFAYLWLKEGNQFHFVKDMEYFHLVGPQSGWLQNAQYNLKKAEEIKKIIKTL